MKDKRKKLILVQRILKQAVEISTTSSIDVFCEYASHVQSLSVKVYKKGWTTKDIPDLKEYVYIDSETIGKDSVTKLKEIDKYLKEIKKNEINR